MVLTKIIFQKRPPPFMANAILNFHFDYLHQSLIESILRSVLAALGASTFDHIRLDELKRA